jgi:iron complex outermembrane receptor protein
MRSRLPFQFGAPDACVYCVVAIGDGILQLRTGNGGARIVVRRIFARRFELEAVLWLCAVGMQAAAQPTSPFDLSIEELGEVRVTTVSRRAEPRSEAAASVYVITAEDIRRSGVTSIPEALRLAPGVEVARNGASEWTISIRGFSSDLSNKLLVLIDGRSVYSPLFAGVFWDVQDTLLADVERIEVVSGPGGTLWGANAVNGVINIITHSASDTQGTYLELASGNEEEAIDGFRHGWQSSDSLSMRAYAKYFERDEAELGNGSGASDDWRMGRAGFALAWDATERDRVNLRADVYTGEEGALIRGDFSAGTLPGPSAPGTIDLDGRNVIMSWRRTLSTDSSLGVQAYYDHTDRQIPNSFNEARDTWNVAFQHDLADRGRHDLQWGGELRSTKDDIGNTLFATFTPDSRSDQTISAFLQDRIALLDRRLFVTLGAKIEHNDYTGSEHQPNARLAWLPGDRHTVWGAVSRAVRVPARLNTDLELFAPVGLLAGQPFYVNVLGSDDFDSEEVTAYEAGYRFRRSERLSFDFAVFDNYYDRLQTQEAGTFTPVPGPPAYLVLPATLDNGLDGETYGGTAAVNWEPLPSWRLQLQYAHLEMDLVREPGSNDAGAANVAGNSPENQMAVRSFIELPGNFSLYAAARYVAELPAQRVPSYTAVDANVEWQSRQRPLRISFTVQNLNDDRHLEFGGDTFIERSAFVRLSWTL